MAQLGDPARVLERALDLTNAVWRFHAVTATWTRCLLLTFRYVALSDEKREGLVHLGFNLGTGAVLALPGLAFIVVTVLTLCAPPLREIYGRRLAITPVPSVPGAGRRPTREVTSG